MLTCLIGKDGLIRLKGGPTDHNQDSLEFNFDLELRVTTKSALEPFPSTPEHFEKAKAYFYHFVGTPDKLVVFAKEMGLPKDVLRRTLKPDVRRFYLEICASVEKALTEACTNKNEPCLEGGCALEGEICLNACLNAEQLYNKTCTNMWVELFQNPNNRIDMWKR